MTSSRRVLTSLAVAGSSGGVVGMTLMTIDDDWSPVAEVATAVVAGPVVAAPGTVVAAAAMVPAVVAAAVVFAVGVVVEPSTVVLAPVPPVVVDAVATSIRASATVLGIGTETLATPLV